MLENAAHVLAELRKPALTVAPGTIEAATARIRGLIERVRLTNGQLADAERQLDRLCKTLSEPVADHDGETAPGQKTEQRDVAILDSLPRVGRTVLATLLAGFGHSATQRPSSIAASVRKCAGDAAKRQELHGVAPPCL
jgi:hypothetical protein